MSVGDARLRFEPIAQMVGLKVLVCHVPRPDFLDIDFLRRAQCRVTQVFRDHVLIYAWDEPRQQVWQWATHIPDTGGLRHRENPFYSNKPPPDFVRRLDLLRFLNAPGITATREDARQRVRGVFDVAEEGQPFPGFPNRARGTLELAIAMRQGDLAAFHEFILLHRRLARQYSRFLHTVFNLDDDEAEQIGIRGLIRAAQLFDPRLGIRFSPYAGLWIRQACQRFGPRAAFLIRLPAEVFLGCRATERDLQRVTAALGPVRSHERLVPRGATASAGSRWWEWYERATNVRSLSHSAEPEFRMARRLVDPAPSTGEGLLTDERSALLNAAIDRLRPRDAVIVRQRYGLDGPPRTLQQIATPLGLTREGARQIISRAHEHLKFLLGDADDLNGASIIARLPVAKRGSPHRKVPRRQSARPPGHEISGAARPRVSVDLKTEQGLIHASPRAAQTTSR